ncbi:hypothetical protein GGR56DRAFT_632733 [Xylariaceae sp. FL0804]|nr:hypothetical protein GGR56DRAFT_632733 [Xylariaceae sp. FL0804]
MELRRRCPHLVISWLLAYISASDLDPTSGGSDAGPCTWFAEPCTGRRYRGTGNRTPYGTVPVSTLPTASKACLSRTHTFWCSKSIPQFLPT